jgi:hypothetical protein
LSTAISIAPSKPGVAAGLIHLLAQDTATAPTATVVVVSVDVVVAADFWALVVVSRGPRRLASVPLVLASLLSPRTALQPPAAAPTTESPQWVGQVRSLVFLGCTLTCPFWACAIFWHSPALCFLWFPCCALCLCCAVIC